MKLKNNKILYYLAVIIIILFCLGPIFWCFVISLTPESEMLKMSSNILPNSIIFDNYKLLFDPNTSEHQTAFTGLYNSMRISLITLAIGIPISIITAYSLARYDFKFKKIFINLLLLTIVIPVFTTIIPVYNIFRNLNMIDSMFWTAIIYVSAFLPLNTWIIMNYIKELPKELWQAAAMDGFSEKQIFTKIVLPLSAPIIITTTLIMFLMAWKQYIIPTILISSYEYKPLTMVMSEFMTRYQINYGIIAGVGILSIIPPAIVAIIFRKFLISGLTSGSVKH